jgi:hypothetical protein
MIVSRPSDVDAPCGGGLGCGAGDYWLDLNVANQSAGALDPVLQLQAMFNTWKSNQVGRPDHYESVVSLSGTTIRANGIDTVTATVELRDDQGTPLGNALPLTAGLAPNSTVSNITFGPAVAQPNGTYTITMQGDLDAGVAVLDIAVNDSFGRVGLWPRPMVTVLDLFGACGAGAVPDGQGGALPALKINGSAGNDRVVEVGFGQPFTLTLDPPVGVPGTFPVGMFALWVNNGQPLPGSVLPLSSAGGAMCFTPSLLAPGAPNVLLADSFGLGGIIAATPTPWSLTIPGLPLVLDASLQGVMMVDPQATIAATNAIYMRLRSLPPPEVQTITPASPTVGQTVSVTGSNFFSGMAGRIGTTLVPVTVQSATQLQFLMPPGVVCDSQLELANLGGVLVSAPINATPVINTLPFSSGPAAGGSSFFVIGSNMLGATVLIGGAPMTVTAQTPTAIIGSTPPGVVGPAVVTVTNANGCQAVATFTYL